MVVTLTLEREIFELNRIDAPEKISGKIRYTGDMIEVDALYVKVARSPYPHAEILSIDTSEASNYARIITANDIPGEKLIGYLVRDQPLLAFEKVRYVGEPVALSVSEDPLKAKLGADKVKVKYNPLKPVLAIADAFTTDNIKVHSNGNIKENFVMRNGDVDKGFKESDIIIEGKYEFPYQEHAYLETEACLAVPTNDEITVIGSMQVPFSVERTIRAVLGKTVKKVRVIQATTGGAFGGKEDAPDEVCTQVALAAYITRKPCFLMNNRKESFIGHPKRHPGYIIRKIGALKDGTLKALEAKIYLDGGAYTSLSPRVLFQSMFATVGPYYIPKVYIEAYVVFTNKVPSGAFRGFGIPQGTFSSETQINELAKKLNIDPVELRLKNLVLPNGKTSWGQTLPNDVGVKDCLLLALNKFGKTFNLKIEGTKAKGIGLAIDIHGSSLGPEGTDIGSAIVELSEKGEVNAKVALTEYGQGIHTGWVEIIRKVTNISPDLIHIIYPDTATMYDSGPTVASRSTIVGGRALLEAAINFKTSLLKAVSVLYNEKVNELFIDGDAIKSTNGHEYKIKEMAEMANKKGIRIIGEGFNNIKEGLFWNKLQGQGVPWKSYSFATHMAEVEVDLETGKVSVVKYCAVQDVGRVINKKLATSQVYGGVVQGLGYALTEELKFDNNGILLTNSFLDYMIPTFADVPSEICVDFVETYNEDGPFGAKGLGEVPIEPVAAAVANAVADAIGKPITSIPITPEKVLVALGKIGGQK
ncbi:MAG: xanthine dehydrogenase family protein molybdopterin-binding subunit [Nitrososphaeria archaeon]